jgi:hypothetical protein
MDAMEASVDKRVSNGSRPAPGGGRPARLARVLGVILLAAGWTATAAQTLPSMTIDDLIAKATRPGTLRVIVEIRVDPSGPPSREAVAQEQDRLLQELSGTGHRVLRRFATIPFISLEVAPDALRRLATSIHVAGVREDMVRQPQDAPRTP